MYYVIFCPTLNKDFNNNNNNNNNKTCFGDINSEEVKQIRHPDTEIHSSNELM